MADDFSSGSDTAWSRLDPLASLGIPSDYAFPNGGYQIRAAVSPDASQTGPSRAGSLIRGQSFAEFRVSVDLVDWEASHDQAMGLLARVSNPGLGTTNGYAFTYSAGHDIDLNRVDRESPTSLARAPTTLALNPADPVRLVFTGAGTTLTGSLYSLSDLTTPIATVTASDDAYASGLIGVVTFDNTDTARGSAGTNVTFDNFTAAPVVPVPEPIGGTTVGGLFLIAALMLRWRTSRTQYG